MLLVFCLLFCVIAEASEGLKGTAKWREIALSKLANLGTEPSPQELLRVAGYLRVAERGDAMKVEHREVVEKIRAAVVALPNHAELIGLAIERGTQGEIDEVRDASEAIRPEHKRWDIYPVLQQLPSPKVVALLGQLLEDDRDPWKGQPAPDYNLPHPNSYLAAKTLNRIGIEGVPVIEPIRDDRDYEAARDQWKLWFAQVKAGNRTFRFKGDPQEYSLDGPVASVPVVNVERRGGQAADLAPAAGATSGSRKPVWLPLALAILGLGVAIARWARGRRTA